MAQCTPKSFDLTGKVALITGASYGIGMAIVVDAADAERAKAIEDEIASSYERWEALEEKRQLAENQ